MSAYPLNGVERLQIMYETFNQDNKVPFRFSYDDVLCTGLNTKDYIAPSSFVFKNGKDFQMGDTIGAVSYLQILAPELTDKMLAEISGNGLQSACESSHPVHRPDESD